MISLHTQNKLGIAGSAERKKRGTTATREFSECPDDRRSCESSKDLQFFFKICFSSLFVIVSCFFRISTCIALHGIFFGPEFIKSVRPDLGGGLQSSRPRYGMHSGGVGVGVNCGDGPFGNGEDGEVPVKICQNILEVG